MFQTFDSPTTPEQGPPRLANLRGWMAQQELNGFIVPRADRHQGEYVASCDERLSWLTGFTGSAGFACILEATAGIFIDGRYRLQVCEQVAEDFTPVHWPETSLHEWLAENAAPGAVIGFDPWLHTVEQIETLRTGLEGSGISLVASSNGIDAIWTDRPDPPNAPAWAHPPHLCGDSAEEKTRRLGAAIAAQSAQTAVITLPDSLCWLLNLRGSDVPRTPIVHCFGLLSDNGALTLFGDEAKFADLTLPDTVTLAPWDAFSRHLKDLTGTVLIEPASLPQAAFDALTSGPAKILRGLDPCRLPKARKTRTELDGCRAAHLRDGAAMVRFLAWFDGADTSHLTEIDIVTQLENCRAATNLLHDISFDTISGSGPHGAVVHYRVTEKSDRPLDADSLLLVDSGAQYQDGTTDITRTLPIGSPSLEMRQAFTRVLKGMIAISQLRFPKGLAGRDIDAIARAPLWAAGQDYDHGTGHGVGSFLSVHEGPQRLSRAGNVPLQRGMILSNEPGYYRPGAFGIRIENLITVIDAEPVPGGDDRAMLAFETLTYAPIDLRLVEISELTDREKKWLNAYHQEVYAKLAPLLAPETAQWLAEATRSI
jgi:Xaa-Pro aminopeptidase